MKSILLRFFLVSLLSISTKMAVIGQPIKAIVAQKPTLDPDAQAFLSATGITDPVLSNALNTLVVSAKTHGWWSSCTAIYPMVGGSSTTCKFNLKDARDLDAAYRITWNNATFNSSGPIANGSNTTWGDTHIAPSTILNPDGMHMSYYSLTNTNSFALADMGSNDGTNRLELRIFDSNLGQGFAFVGNSEAYYFSNPGLAGYFLTTKNSSSSSDCKIYKDGQQISLGAFASGKPDGMPTGNLALMNTNDGPIPDMGTPRNCGFATIGLGVTATLAGAMFADIQTFVSSK